MYGVQFSLSYRDLCVLPIQRVILKGNCGVEERENDEQYL